MKLYKLLSVLLILAIFVVIGTKPADTAKKTIDPAVASTTIESSSAEYERYEKDEDEPEVVETIEAVNPESIENVQVAKPIEPEIFGFLPLDNNIFGFPILAGYYLNSVPNASIAARLLNNITIYPGETFSFNNVVGNRTTERGFVSGTVIMGDKYVPGVGGGVCRASTAMYNIAQAAQLPILQRTGHTMPIAYASRGRDAAVWWPEMDLQFINNKDYPIQIKTLEQDGKLYFGLMLLKPVEQPEVTISDNQTEQEPVNQSE